MTRSRCKAMVLICAALVLALDASSRGHDPRWRVDVLENGAWREVETELVLTPDGHRNLHFVPDEVLKEYDGPSFWSRHVDDKVVVRTTCQKDTALFFRFCAK